MTDGSCLIVTRENDQSFMSDVKQRITHYLLYVVEIVTINAKMRIKCSR